MSHYTHFTTEERELSRELKAFKRIKSIGLQYMSNSSKIRQE